MIKKLIFLIIVVLCAMPVAMWAMQETPAPQVEITGVNATALPEVFVTANVFGANGQPVRDLTAADFQIVGELAEEATITNVQHIQADEIPYSVVLVIDVSSSMDGLPIQLAKEAALLFIDNIRENTSVALMTFGSDVDLVQEFTTDKAALREAIESIQVGGVTALYQAAYDAIGVAARAPTPRRAVILLSDGAEYGDASTVGRGAAAEEAAIRGVSFYNVGLGYGIDRTFLIELSRSTNARFVESPDVDQLAESYRDLAALLQSQYVIDLNVDVPLDGTEYDLTLEVTTPSGAASTTTTLRAPVPVPIVSLDGLDAPLEAVTEITPTILADDEISRVDVQIDGADPAGLFEAPYTFTIDPETLAPGAHQLDITVIDVNGDSGTINAEFEVAALPPRVTVISNLDQEVGSVQTVLLEVGGQTPPTSATYTIDGERPQTVSEVPFAYDIDPMTLVPGEHLLTIDVTNEGGGETTVEVPFTVAALPPIIVLVGLEEGQIVDEPTEVEINIIASQTPVTDVEMTVNGEALDALVVPPEGTIMSTATIDPMVFAPGNAVLEAIVSTESGTEATWITNFVIAALPPVTVIENLTEGEVIEENRDVGIRFISQTPVNHVAYFIDDEELAHRFQPPWDVTLDVLELEPGPHTLLIAPQTTNGQASAASVNFVVSDAASLTATALAPTPTPSDTPTPTLNVPATQTLQARITANAEATIAANTEIARDASATERSVAATGTASADATGTANAVAEEAAAQGTANAQSTLSAQAELNAQGTAFAQATLAARSTTNAEIRGTRSAQATLNADATVTAESGAAEAQTTQDARATDSAMTQDAGQQTQTAEAQTATREIERTNTAEARQAASATAAAEEAESATRAAAQTVTAEARIAASATSEFEAAQASTLEARQTSTAEAVLTQAVVTATANAQATETQQAEAVSAQQTADAMQAATQSIRETQSMQAELNAQGTAFAQSTRAARSTQNAVIETQRAESATETAQAEASAEAEQATLDAAASATQERESLGLTRTAAAATRASDATQSAQATIDTQLTAIATEDVLPTQVAQLPTEETEEPEPTSPTSPTPRPTLVPIEIEGQSAGLSSQIIPILIVLVVIVVIAGVIYLTSRNKSQ